MSANKRPASGAGHLFSWGNTSPHQRLTETMAALSAELSDGELGLAADL